MEKRVTFRSAWLPYALLAPQLAITVVFFFWPAFQAVWFSFQLQDAFGLSTQFVWFDNFIALFKDTSVCSVITLTELTKRYSILFNTHGGVVEFGLATAALYMAMSLPLSWFSRWIERRLDDGPTRAGGRR